MRAPAQLPKAAIGVGLDRKDSAIMFASLIYGAGG
jgi:hypothetical protein